MVKMENVTNQNQLKKTLRLLKKKNLRNLKRGKFLMKGSIVPKKRNLGQFVDFTQGDNARGVQAVGEYAG